MSHGKAKPLPLRTEFFFPGTRLGVAVSGGADSVALLHSLGAVRPHLGLVLVVLHVHHGIRGAEADEDALFVEDLAHKAGLRFQCRRVNTPEYAREAGETMEEAARSLRYAWFDELLGQGELDAIATAHTMEDQAETVLLKLLRGAWTEGLAGIFPQLKRPRGLIVRPFLQTRRAEIRQWLRASGHVWREDGTNQDMAYARNKVRHHLLPVLEQYNPQIVPHLAQMAEMAREEELFWQAEMARLLPSLVLPGRPVRGGGRAQSTHPEERSVGMEMERLHALSPAVRRRVLRAAAQGLGLDPDFDQTELLLRMCDGRAGQRETLTAELTAERSARELRLIRSRARKGSPPEYEVAVPGEVEAPAFGLRLRVRISEGKGVENARPATLRAHKAGDRVLLRHTSGPKRMKEVLERMRVLPGERTDWPVLEWQGEIVWMKGAEVVSRAAEEAGLKVEVELR